MLLEEKINADYIEAYKSKNEEVVSTLRLLRSNLKNAAIAKKAELEEEEVIRILKKEVKQRQEAAAEYEKGGRLDLAGKERSEAGLIQKYLPEELSEATLRDLIAQTISELNITDPSQKGRVIGAVVAKAGGKTDGGTVAKLVNEILR